MLQLPDALAVLLVLGAATAFALAELALAQAADLRGAYFVVIAVVGLRAATRLGRPRPDP